MKNTFFSECMLFRSKNPLFKFLGIGAWIWLIGIVLTAIKLLST